jgi:hypothetical protein
MRVGPSAGLLYSHTFSLVLGGFCLIIRRSKWSSWQVVLQSQSRCSSQRSATGKSDFVVHGMAGDVLKFTFPVWPISRGIARPSGLQRLSPDQGVHLQIPTNAKHRVSIYAHCLRKGLSRSRKLAVQGSSYKEPKDFYTVGVVDALQDSNSIP